MTRDYQQYPDDENGDVLLRMAEDGDNLATAREIDFSVIFPNEEAALGFATHLLRNGQKVSMSAHEGNSDLPWEVTAHPVMVPTHAHVTGYENQLGTDAEPFGGRNDGWGCFAQD